MKEITFTIFLISRFPFTVTLPSEIAYIEHRWCKIIQASDIGDFRQINWSTLPVYSRSFAE